MKTIEQLEKEFDDFLNDGWFSNNEEEKEKIKNYIFRELLQQVLSEIIPEKMKDNPDVVTSAMIYGNNNMIDLIKRRAKEMGINLPE